MEGKWIISMLFGVLFSSFVVQQIESTDSSSQIIAAYWGQNSVSHKIGITVADHEKPLVHFCNNSTYNIILISFMHVFFDPRNKDNFPGINLSKHCFTTVSAEYPTLLSCPAIGAAVKVCQRNNKKVLLSIGGATNGYSIPNNTKAVELADRVWNLFLGGTQYSTSFRPFGNSILDGIDLDIENHDPVGYAAFTNRLRVLMSTDRNKAYLITGAPQCPYPDASLGPSMDTVLTSAGHQIDYLFVQYYNNFCYPGGGHFDTNLEQWLDWSESINLIYKKSPKIIVGLPAGNKAAIGNKYFKTVEETKQLIIDNRDRKHFGGIMFWDAGWDQNELANGRTYSEQIRGSLLTGESNPGPTNPATNSTNPATNSTNSAENSSSQIIAAYWGQNSVAHKLGITVSDHEKPLVHFCKNSSYDIILISSMHVFFDPQNKDSFPGINLSKHCFTTVSAEYPTLLSCPDIGAAVKVCQRNNKKILLSIGGSTGGYSIPNNTKAVELADRVWNLFLGGTQYSTSLRPFGNSTLDGIDLDIKNNDPVGYTAFTNRLRLLMSTDRNKEYLITGAPQCHYPDASLGPSLDTVLTSAGHQIDYLFVQYYHYFCYPGGGHFDTNLKQWLNLSESINLIYKKSPKIIVGLLAGNRTAIGNKYFKNVEETKQLIMDIRYNKHFGGIMFWDAGWDQNELTNGTTYSEQIRGSLLTREAEMPSTGNQCYGSLRLMTATIAMISLVLYFT